MDLHLCRCRAGFLLSPECIQAPAAAQSLHGATRQLGAISSDQLSAGLAARMAFLVTRDGWAYVDRASVGADELERLAERFAPVGS